MIFTPLKRKIRCDCPAVNETEKILWDKRDLGPRKILVSLKEETVRELNKLKALKAHSCRDMDELLLKMISVVKEEWD